MISSHLFLLMLNCFLGAASLRTMKGSSGSAQDSSFLPSSPDPFSDDLDQDMVSQHMSKLYEKYNRENRLKEGNTVRSFRASQGVWMHWLTCAIDSYHLLQKRSKETFFYYYRRKIVLCAFNSQVIWRKKQKINIRRVQKAPIILSMDGY